MLDRVKAEGLEAIAARDSAFESYNNAMSEAVTDTVWFTGGCNSWYIDNTGKPNLYPWHPDRYLEEMAQPDFEEFRLMENTETDR